MEATYVSNSNAKTEFEQLKIENEENREDISSFTYFCAIIASMVTTVELGFVVVWISPVATNLLSDDPNVNPLGAPITTVQLSAIGALPTLGSIVGAVLFAKTADIFGRKTAMVLLSLPVLSMKILLAFASNIYMIYIPGLVIGFCLGGVVVPGKIYLAEISEDRHRARLVCMGVLGMPLGNVCSFIISSWIPSYKLFSLACCVPLLVSVGCLIMFLPETPVYLISRGRTQAAFEALDKLRNTNSDGLHRELNAISYVLEETSKSKTVGFRSMFADRAVRRAFLISLVLHFIAFSNGASVIVSFLLQILDKSGSSIPSYVSSNLLTLVQLSFCFIATQTSERCGRRTLLLVTSLGNAVSLLSIATFFYLKSLGFTYMSWWPVVGLIVFYISNSVGIGSICWVIASEVFPNDVVSVAMSVLTCIDSIIVCLMVFLFPIITAAVGMYWNFLVYSVVCALGYIFVYLKVPETKGKSLLEIQALLRK